MNQTAEQQRIWPNREPGPDRMETAHLRKLPVFVIIGAQKGGTTSLNHYLAGHPEVGETFKKEVHFFDFHFDRGLDWYRAHFPLHESATVVGEASPSYLFHPEAARRVWVSIPGIKLIALLRNPVDRAYSQYQMNVRRGFESLPFAAAIAFESNRLKGGEQSANNQNWRNYSYVSRGLYADQLERWLALFPRERLHIIRSEDFFQNPARVYDETLEYLELRPWRLTSYESRKSRSYGAIDAETRYRLTEYFAPHNRRLYDLLGRDLGWEGDVRTV